MFGILLVLILAVHLLAVDIAMAGPLVCVWIEWRHGRNGDEAGALLARRLAWISFFALLGGSVLGGMALACRWWADPRYLDVFAAIPRDRLWFAGFELLFSTACLLLYAALWHKLDRHRIWRRLLAIAGATNLLAHFPVLFAIVSILSTRVPLLALDRPAYRALIVSPEVLSRTLHVWLAAFAVTGMLVVAMAAQAQAVGGPWRKILRGGAWLALVTTAAQMPAGMWLTLEMPEAQLSPLLGGDWLAMSLFLASLGLSLYLLHLLSAIAWGDLEPGGLVRRQARNLAVVVPVVFLMVATRQRLQSERPLFGNSPTAPSQVSDRPAPADGLRSAGLSIQ